MQENVEVVKGAIDAYNRGDWDVLLQDAAPGFKMDVARAVGPWRGLYRLDQIRPVVGAFRECWESVRIEPREFLEAGDLVVVPCTMHAKGRGRIEVVSFPTFVCTIHDGAIDRVSMYEERQEALEAVGLSE
jgi:ketosteroid isomerase-like protein